ncbi:TonB-dependent receptor [Caulobacter sp.]|uniref:TonB-dependent receptor n=1 Tax=Caulobacter sp. TaxID=78 RepID=UPI0031E1B3BA
MASPRAYLLGAAVLTGILTPAFEAQAAGRLAVRREYTIAGGSLSDAIRELSRQAGVAIVADSALIRRRVAQPLRTRGTAREALAQLVGPSLRVRVIGDTLAVEAAPVQSLPEAPATPVTAVEAVVILGRDGATREALELKRRNAGVSDIISADDQGTLPTSNVAESLARLPGVNVLRNHQTGEGDRITVRGMGTEWNAYRINGVRLGGVGSRADKFYRGVRLGYLPPEGVDTLTVHKTLTPDMDGDALGGLIDIRTPTAFDAKRDYVRVSVERGWLTRFDNPPASKLAVAASRRFSDRLGVFVAANWSDARSRFEMVGGDSDDLPPAWYPSVQTTGLDADTFLKRGMELAVGDTRVRRVGVNGSLDWRGEAQTAHLRFQFNHYEGQEYRNRLNFRNDGLKGTERLTQADLTLTGLRQPQDMVVGSDPVLGRVYGYTPAQMKDVDGDGRITDADRKTRSVYSLEGASGVWDPMGFRLRRFWEATQESGLLSSITLGGEKWAGPWTLDYDLSVSRSQDYLDDGYTLEFRTDAVGWLGNRGVAIIETDDPRYPLWGLNAAGLKGVQDPASYKFRSLSGGSEKAAETLVQGQIDITYAPTGSWLETVRMGGRYMRSDRKSVTVSRPALEGPATLADLSGLFGETVTDLFSGRYTGVHQLGVTFSTDALLAELKRAYAGDGRNFTIDPESEGETRQTNFRLNEDALAGYAMATARWGDNLLTGGVRVEYTHSRMVIPVVDAIRGGGLLRRGNNFINVLPSVHYRRALENGLVVRAAVWTSFARPDIARMTSAQQYVYDQDPDKNGEANPESEWVLTEVRQGNPDLRPMEATGYDLSLERYGGSTIWSLALYRKEIRNFLYRASTSTIRDGGLIDNGSQDGVPVKAYVNGRWARITGLELGLRHAFDRLPPQLGKLGLTATLTWQVSKAAANISWRPPGDVLPFTETPEILASMELFWQGGGWEAAVGWNHQSPFLEGMDSFGNDPYERGYSFVDLSIRRRFGDTGLASLQVRNALNSHTYWYTFGSGPDHLREYVRNGPTVTLAITRSF